MDNMKSKAFRFIDGHRDEMPALWQEMVNMESGSEDTLLLARRLSMRLWSCCRPGLS